DQSQRLSFFAPVGMMPENADKEVDIMRKLLSANFFWRETFGATLGYDARTRLIVMAYEEPIAGITFDVFQDKLKVFVDTLELWKNRLEGKADDTKKKETASGNFPLDGRV
ncbi:MAG TPA: type III secretion system chaperone, partial [Opitutales bacterium]|nr:type III secretion system chaperone [Opitutales bacterium]